jgi:putative endonuclease
VLGTNVWAGGNELDLIVRRGRELRFVEVREKRTLDPFESVTAEKQRRVRRAAAAWLATRPEQAGLRVGFDVVGVRAGKLERLSDAF